MRRARSRTLLVVPPSRHRRQHSPRSRLAWPPRRSLLQQVTLQRFDSIQVARVIPHPIGNHAPLCPPAAIQRRISYRTTLESRVVFVRHALDRLGILRPVGDRPGQAAEIPHVGIFLAWHRFGSGGLPAWLRSSLVDGLVDGNPETQTGQTLIRCLTCSFAGGR